MGSILLINVEVYILIHVLILLGCSGWIQETVLNLKYRINLLKVVTLFCSYILWFSIVIMFYTYYYDSALFNYQLVFDNVSFFFKFFTLLLGFITILSTRNYFEYEKIRAFEHLIILMLSIIGLLTIISSYDFLTMYLGIELQSLCFYVLTCLKFYSNFSIEAGLKYFILGALSSGILLFGCSVLYGLTGLSNFMDITALFYYYNLYNLEIFYYEGVLMALVLIYCGILFKIGIVPFHMWVSDIYEGSPTNITFFFAVVPQIGVLCLILRLNIVFVYIYLKDLYWFFLILSVLSIIIGTLGAMFQIKIKRILAYSGISNMGYILSIISATNNTEVMYSIIFYIIAYNLISLGLWILLLNLRYRNSFIKLKEIGEIIMLFRSNKYISIIFFIFLFSAMGIPPMLGFISKLCIFLNLIGLKMYFFSFFLIIINSIGVIYYLRLVQVMYSSVSEKFLFMVELGDLESIFLVSLVYLNIFFFFYPNYIFILINNLIMSIYI